MGIVTSLEQAPQPQDPVMLSSQGQYGLAALQQELGLATAAIAIALQQHLKGAHTHADWARVQDRLPTLIGAAITACRILGGNRDWLNDSIGQAVAQYAEIMNDKLL